MKSETLWSETMLEMLFFALREAERDPKIGRDKEIREILRELRTKGYRSSFLVDQAKTRIDATAAWRVRRLAA